MNTDIKLHSELIKSDIELILSVPCAMLKGLIKIINKKERIHHIPATREEEAVGIAVGAYMGGNIPLILMQNSGLGNSINAIKSLAQIYKIPLIFMMSHRGAEGEKIVAQEPMGSITTDLLECVDIKNYTVKYHSDIPKIRNAVEYAQKHKSSVSILLKRTLWEEN
ncbi:MAG: sulfopyruvate decarboxylase subunit alpha [Promethearchaeia archaeon]